MPSERFYRLPEEKRNVIRQAIVHEYARVPIDKVSINKIIKNANISRGSFYTYFDDKWDILAYIFEDGRKSLWQFCTENLEKHKGNLWNMLEDFQMNVMERCMSDDTYEFIKSVMEHSRSEDMFSGFSDQISCEHGKLAQWIYERVDKTDFRHHSFEDFYRFLEITAQIMGNGIKDLYKGLTEAQVKEDFVKKLELLRYGMCVR